MARSTYTHIDAASSAANYINTYKPLSDALKALTGLVQTADTGQVNWATVTTTPTSNVVRDFDVFRFDDALQPTKPIFVRFDYMTVTGNPRLGVSVGTGTDGAGNLTGVIAPRTELSTTTSNSLASRTGYLSFNDGCLTLQHSVAAGATAPTPYNAGVVIDRSRTGSGQATGAGYGVWNLTSGMLSSTIMRVTADGFTGEQPPVDFNVLELIPNKGATTAFVGDTAYAFPVYSATPDVNGPCAGLLLAFPNDYPTTSEVAIPFLGTTKRFMSFNQAITVPVVVANSATTQTRKQMAALLRWD